MLDELKIINSLLSTIGVDGLTASDDQHPDFVKARNQVKLTTNSCLKLGFWFNTTYPVFTPNENGEIMLPNDTLHTDALDTSVHVVKRGRKLYNIAERTFVFDAGTAIRVKHIATLALDELPETVLDYIRQKARYEFYVDNDGDEGRARRYEGAANQAWVELYREHLRNLDITALNSPASRRMTKGRRAGTSYSSALNAHLHTGTT